MDAYQLEMQLNDDPPPPPKKQEPGKNGSNWYRENETGTFEKKLSSLLRTRKSKARKAGIEFSITADDFEPTYFCPLLRSIEFNFSNDGKSRSSSMSLDRIDPTKGYVKGNVQLISQRANRIKNNATLEEFEEIAYNWRKLEERRKREENT